MSFQEPEDNIFDELIPGRRRLQRSLETASTLNPDTVASDRREAARRGMPVDTYATARQQNVSLPPANWQDLPDQFPEITAFLSRPENAAVAHDDIENLSGVERIMARIGQGTVRLGKDLARTALTAVDAPADFLERNIPLGTVSFEDGRIVRRATTEADRRSQVGTADMSRALRTDLDWQVPQGITWEEFKQRPLERLIPFALEEGVVSLPDMAAAVAALPLYVASRVGGIGQERAQNDARSEATVEDLVAALPAAAGSALLERFGTKGILGIGDELTGRGVRAIAGAAGRAGTRELLTEAGQEGLEYAGASVGTEAGFDPVTALDRMAQGAVIGGPFGATVRGATATAEDLQRRFGEREAQAAGAEQAAQTLQDLATLSEASRLREREPATFQQFVEQMTENGPVENVYVDAQTFAQSLNDAGVSIEEVTAAIPALAEQLPTALPTGGTLRMTAGEFATHIAGTDAAAALLPHLRTNALGMSQAEAKEFMANRGEALQAEVETAVAQATATEELRAGRERLQTRITEELNAAGRFTKDVNAAYASLPAAFYDVMAARTGMTAEQLAEKYQLRYAAELPTSTGRRVMEQEESVDLIHYSSTPGIMTSDPTQWGSSRATPASEREARAAGAPGRTYFDVKGVYNGEPQTGINSRFFRYKARIPASKLYDFDKDPQGLKPTEGTPMEIATAYEKAIQGAGFSGYRSDAMIPGAVAVFDAIGMEQEGPVRTVQDGQRLAARMMELAYQDRLARLAASTDPEEIITTRPAEDFREQALSELFGSSYAQSASLRDGRETLQKFGLDPNKRYSTRQVAAALEARQRAKYGSISAKDRSPEAAKKIAKWMAEEVQFELQNPEQSGVGWYSTKFQAALDIFAQEFPELATDKDARDTFTALIAITSDGQKVVPNFQQAAGIYRAFKADGRFVADRGTQRQASVDQNLAKVQELYDTLGPAGMRETLLQELTVSELKKKASALGVQFSDRYKADVKLPLAAVIFGPKLGAFYANLMGADGYLTMDRWWSRTFNRYRGTLLQKPTARGLARFRELLGQPNLSDDEALAATVGPRNAYAARKYKNPSEIEAAANTLYKAAFENIEDQPFNASDRSFMLATVAQARATLKRQGVEISVADIQAVLWYYEKRLYGGLGARQTADVSYEEAAQRVVAGQTGDAGPLGPDLGGDWEAAAEQSDPGALAYNQGPLARSVESYFSPENIGSLLEKDDWTILMAANPQGNEVSAEENEKALAELAAELDALGVDYQPSVGRYGQLENSFVVVGITEKQARDLGKKYDQDSVLTRKGLIYQDGRVDEAVGVIVYDTAPTEDFYTEIPGTGVMFALDIPALRGEATYNQSDPFYSALERAVEQSPLTKAPAAQWMATLSKTPGVKKEEIEITGLQDYLDGLAGQTEEFKAASSQVDAKGNITKEAVLGFVRANGVQLEETVLTGDLRIQEYEGEDGETEYEITDLEGNARASYGSYAEAEAALDAQGSQFSDYKLPGADDTYREILLSLPDVEGPSTHWDKQNVVAHARITGREDAAGKRVLFIEELQSDWHQKGRDQGYQQPADPVAQEEARLALTAATAARDAARTDFAEEVVAEGEVLLARLQASQEKAKASLGAEGDAVLAERIAKLNGALNTITDQLAAKEFARASQQASFLTYNAANGLGKTEAMQAAIDRLEQAQLAALEAEVAYDAASGETGIPDAPWKKSWDALLMKRMIRYAVDNGFEQIAWINGNQQNGGQTGGDGAWFYERVLINTTNDIIKKFGTRVGPVDMRPADADERDQREVERLRVVNTPDAIAALEATLAEKQARPATSLGIQNGFEITPELAEAARKGFALFQPNRGQIAFGQDITQTPSVISLLRAADLSTFIHETGHFFLEATADMANATDAPADIVADMATALNWMRPGMTLADWNVMSLEERRPFHEKWARGFEAYHFEGRSPSLALRDVFRRFSAWLKNVYKSLTALDVELTDEVRQVMDRMLATEAEITEMEQARGLVPAFTNKPEFASDDEWEEYQRLAGDATAEAIEQLETRSARDMRWASGAKDRYLRSLQREGEEQRKAIRAEVTAEVMAEPVNRARAFLRRGLGENGEPVEGAAKLDLATLKALYPADGPWTQLRRGGKYGEVGTDGLHPDIVAGWFGYSSGEALIEDLVNGENAAEKIKGLTDQRMLERYGDLSDAQAVERAANEAVANEARGKFVAAEMAMADKAIGKKSILNSAAKEFAASVVNRLELKRLRPSQYLAAQGRAAKAAEKALKADDLPAFATAKRNQLVNLHTGRAVQQAQKDVEKTMRLFTRIVSAKDDSISRSRNMDLVNAARAILAKYGVGRVKNDVAGYIKAVQTYDPELFADLASVFGDLVNPERPLNELTYGEYVAVRDAVRQLWQQSRQSKVIEIDGQQRTIESVVGELNAQMDEVQPNADVAAPETTPSKEDRRGHEILGVRAMLRRVESWARGVDVRAQGPFTRYIWNPISEASDRYRRDSAAYLRRLNELMETMREDMKPRDIAAPELGFVFKSKAVLYHAMLHTGNLSNKTKLLLGYGWGKRTEDGQLDDSRWQAFMDRLHAEGVITERDWAFVQSVWDLLEETKPGAQRAHHIMYGRYFDEITADPVVTPFGTLRGGYVPALTESYFVQDAMLRSGEDGLESNAASQMFPSAGNGFTKGREENYTQPLSLELGLLPAHLDKVVKFTHLGPAVRQAMRLLKNRKLAARLKAFDPTAQTDLLLPWLQRAAKQTVESQGIGNGGKWVDRTARYLRGTVGMQLMFANVINTAQQVVGGPFAAAVRVKPSRLGQAHWRFMRDPAEVTTAATNLSTALAVRMDNQIMETRQNINEIIDLDPNALGSARRWAIRHGYFMQSAVQNVMDPIIWTAAFDQATSEGASVADAVRFADSVLRETQGSWNPEDVSRLETGSPFVRMFTQFGGWANMLANLNATETQIVARGVGVGKGKGRLFYVYLMGFAAQALVGQAIADLMRGGWDDDEEDGYLDEALNWFFGSQLKLGLSAIPIAGPLANVALGGFTEARFDDRLSVSPVLSVVEGGLLAPASVYDSVVNGEKFNRADVRNVLTLLGLVSGLPLVPLAKPLGYAADVVNEDVEPTGPLDAARGAITGAPSPGSKTQ